MLTSWALRIAESPKADLDFCKSLFPIHFFCRLRIKLSSLSISFSSNKSCAAFQKQIQDQAKAEVNYLGQLRHPNLVKLIGYCCEGDHRLLVYEYMASGSLEKHLFLNL